MAETKTPAPPAPKHFPTVFDNSSLQACNAEAHGAQVGAKKRRAASMKRIQELVAQELKRA